MGIGLSTVNTGEGSASGGSVQQYTVGATSIGATGTGVLFVGINATTARAIKVDANGVVAVSGGGGGVQYSVGETSMAATGTGTLFIGIQSGATTGRGLAVSVTGGLHIASMPTVGGGQQYSVGNTDMGVTATGTVLLGIVSTTARALLINTTGGIGYIDTVGNISTGTVSISGTSNFILVSGTVSTVLAMPVLSAANVTIASITTGTVSVATGLINISGTVPVTLASLATVSTLLGTIAISGTATALPSGTQDVNITNTPVVTATYATTPTFIQVNYATLWNAYVVATTSAAGGVIVKTSGAHTLYVTDLVVAATGPNDVSILSETTVGGPVAYLATKGGFVYNARTPFVCNTAQSLRVVLASSGSVTVFAAGYTVT